MGEDSFFNALFHVMWNMETDIFSEKEKTLGLLADLVPKCQKQRKRLEAMYRCGAMDFIEKAVANPEEYKLNLKRAVRLLVNEIYLSKEKALFAVNQIIALWNGDLAQLEEYDEEEESDSKENEIYEDSEDGEDDMIFMNVTTEEADEEKQEAEYQREGGNEEEHSQTPKDSIIKKLVFFWCEGDFEDGRPYMFACPIGWILIILCGFLGGVMIYDIPLGDKFVVPTFAFMFAVLTSKRLYRFESTGRFSLLIGAFYIAAMVRALWLGKGELSIACIPVLIASLIVFNSGRIGSWLDESKKNSFVAYSVIVVLSAVITIGVYAIQKVEF